MRNQVQKLIENTLHRTGKQVKNQFTINEIVDKTSQVKKLIESCSTSDCSPKKDIDPIEPLKQQYFRYIKQGNSFKPAGDVKLAETLAPCPYKIVMTFEGPVFERIKPLTDEIINFKDSKMESILTEIDRFWGREEHYNKLGFVQSRGIIMHGPPGTGKSICLQQVTELMSNRGDVVFFADSPSSIRAGMEAFRQIEPKRPAVVAFEEAEEVCRYGERDMLRLLDGDAKIGKVLYLATTNHLDRMPPRMIRNSRFDRRIYIGYPTFEQRKEYLQQKLKDSATKSDIIYMAEKTENMGFADLKELVAGVYALGDPIDTVLARLKESGLE